MGTLVNTINEFALNHMGVLFVIMGLFMLLFRNTGAKIRAFFYSKIRNTSDVAEKQEAEFWARISIIIAGVGLLLVGLYLIFQRGI
jgi:hypothetical protein